MLLQFGRMDREKEKYGTYGIQLITTLVNLELSKRIRLYQVNMAGKSDYIQLIKMYETLRTKVEERGQSLENFGTRKRAIWWKVEIFSNWRESLMHLQVNLYEYSYLKQTFCEQDTPSSL